MNFYKHYIGDFQRDTGHLSLTERGAYLCLIHHYYATEKPLPNDLDALCRIAGAVTKIDRAAVKVAIGFFEPVASGLMHARIEAELEKAGEISNTNRAIALAREEKRRAEKAARMKHEQSTNRAQSVPRTEHEQSTKPEPDTRHQVNPEAIASGVDSTVVEPEDKTRLPPGPDDELSPTARVCLGLKAMGYSDTSPHDPKLAALIDAGMTPEEILSAGQSGKGKAKGFRWVLATAEGRRRDAENIVPLPDAQTETTGAGRLSLAGQQTQAAAERLLRSMETEA